ncbi:MAG: PQQ-binding-like beta-propeller repeat protein, partial [Bryobacteraceae bacterium]
MKRICLLFAMAILPLDAQCPTHAPMGDPSATPAWNGWGADASNTRFQAAAQLPAGQVSRLKLKWTFGFPGVRSVLGQPAIAGGRVFMGVDNGTVYSLDAASGCMYWSFKAEAGVRTAVTIQGSKPIAYFGDLRANVYALDASTGAQIWKVRVEEHASARITGSPKFYGGNLYVPVASGEEGAGGQANYACCTFRGSVVALDAATGKQVWKTYMIADEPKVVGKKSNGVERWAPAGAGVWNSPTIDPKRGALYVGTGDAYAEPAAKTTDAIVALDLKSGKILWSFQDTAN